MKNHKPKYTDTAFNYSSQLTTSIQ